MQKGRWRAGEGGPSHPADNAQFQSSVKSASLETEGAAGRAGPLGHAAGAAPAGSAENPFVWACFSGGTPKQCPLVGTSPLARIRKSDLRPMTSCRLSPPKKGYGVRIKCNHKPGRRVQTTAELTDACAGHATRATSHVPEDLFAGTSATREYQGIRDSPE